MALVRRVRARVAAMEPRRRRLAVDVATGVCAVVGLVLVVVGAAPAEEPKYLGTGQEAAAEQEPLGPPGPAPAASTRLSQPAGQPSSRPPAGGSPSSRPPAAGAAGVGTVALGASVPVHLDIPAIGVSSALMELGLNTDGTIAVPPLRAGAPAGWYRNLSSPGEIGPAVILGHVDTAREGPAVFYQLRELRPGDEISVRRADGRTAVFGVERVVEYPKAAFPSEEVYGAVDRPVLRLITCGGTFDRVHRSYRGNVVVFATLRRAG